MKRETRASLENDPLNPFDRDPWVRFDRIQDQPGSANELRFFGEPRPFDAMGREVPAEIAGECQRFHTYRLQAELLRKAFKIYAPGGIRQETGDYGNTILAMVEATIARLPDKHRLTFEARWPKTWRDHLLKDLGSWLHLFQFRLLRKKRFAWVGRIVGRACDALLRRVDWATHREVHDAYLFFLSEELPRDYMRGDLMATWQQVERSVP